jgi:hypothetical protein
MFLKYILKQQASFTLLRITCFFWLLAKLIGWKVWLPFRTFPVVPPTAYLHVPAPVHVVLFAASLICLIVITINPYKKKLWLALLIAELFSCALDQNRWQPWEYQYLFILFVFIVHKDKDDYIIPSIACILIATYFYSAINKFNNGFLSSVWSDMILHRYFKISKVTLQNHTLYYAGYLLPVIELASCIALIFPSTKKTAACLLIAMHVFILAMLGPFGLHYNKIVWPWNILMIVMLWMIFIKHDAKTRFSWKKTNRLVAWCWIVLPALQFAGLWDSYLSYNLYSGNNASMVICVNDSISNLPEAGFFDKRNSLAACGDGHQLNIQNWAMNEMNVPAYPEERIYSYIKKDWLNKYPSLHSEFYIRYSHNFLLINTAEEYKKMQ